MTSPLAIFNLGKETWMMRSRYFCILLFIMSLIVPLASARATSSADIPILDPRSDQPIDLVFEEPASVLDIYRALGQAWGINVLFDAKLKDQEIAIVLERVTPREGFENLLRAVNHFYIVLDPHTVMVADDTPQNRRTYEHQVIQRFYLENTEVKDMMTLLRSLIGAKHIAADERGNSVVLRDTADKIQVAEQLLRRSDRPQGEVVVEVDLLSVDGRKLRQLGLQTATEAPSATAGEAPPRLKAGELDRIRRQSSARPLAEPSLNILTGSSGKLRLTDRLPLPAAFADARAESSGDVVYQEVGLALEVEPWVHSAEEVSLRLVIAVDTLTDWLTDTEGKERPVFGRRSVESSLRLRDGETYLMTGLMIAPERPDSTKGSFHFGRFLSQAGDHREVILALTPRIVRGPGISEDALAPLWIGTEGNIAIRGGISRPASPSAGPFDKQTDRN